MIEVILNLTILILLLFVEEILLISYFEVDVIYWWDKQIIEYIQNKFLMLGIDFKEALVYLKIGEK